MLCANSWPAQIGGRGSGRDRLDEPAVRIAELRALIGAQLDHVWVQIFCNGGNLIDSARLISVTLSGSIVCG
jgi:hypothetical protein